MTKLIGGLQMVLGIFAANVAVSLVRKIPGAKMPILTSTPDSTVEITLIVLGAAIAIVAILQKLRHMRFAEVQIFLGLVIVAASIFLYSETISKYYYSSGSFWLVYLILASASLTAVAVFMQFFVGGLKNEPGY